MRLAFLLVFIFNFCFLSSSYCQKMDTVFQMTEIKDEYKEWHTSPSLRWNATGTLNPWFPAASLVFEYPINRYIGIESEVGVLLPFAEVDFEGEKFNGVRARIGPKLYVVRRPSDVLYMRALFKYDYAKGLEFRTLLNIGQSFQEDRLVESTLENIGYIIFLGYMANFNSDNFVLDISLGMGGTKWEEELNLSKGEVVQFENQIFRRNRLIGSFPVIAFNFQFGYMF